MYLDVRLWLEFQEKNLLLRIKGCFFFLTKLAAFYHNKLFVAISSNQKYKTALF